MTKRKDTPLDLIVMARGWLDMTERYPELLQADDVPQKIAEVREAFRELMAFRNIVAAMAPMREPPADAAREFLEQ